MLPPGTLSTSLEAESDCAVFVQTKKLIAFLVKTDYSNFDISLPFLSSTTVSLNFIEHQIKKYLLCLAQQTYIYFDFSQSESKKDLIE